MSLIVVYLVGIPKHSQGGSLTELASFIMQSSAHNCERKKEIAPFPSGSCTTVLYFSFSKPLHVMSL